MYAIHTCNCIRLWSALTNYFVYCPPLSWKRGDIKSRSSVRPSVRPSVCPSQKFNLGHNFCTFKGRALILGMGVLCDETFPMVPCCDLDGDLWPTPSGGHNSLNLLVWLLLYVTVDDISVILYAYVTTHYSISCATALKKAWLNVGLLQHSFTCQASKNNPRTILFRVLGLFEGQDPSVMLLRSNLRTTNYSRI